MAFRLKARAWQGLKVFLGHDCCLLYRVFANILMRKTNKKAFENTVSCICLQCRAYNDTVLHFVLAKSRYVSFVLFLTQLYIVHAVEFFGGL